MHSSTHSSDVHGTFEELGQSCSRRLGASDRRLRCKDMNCQVTSMRQTDLASALLASEDA